MPFFASIPLASGKLHTRFGAFAVASTVFRDHSVGALDAALAAAPVNAESRLAVILDFVREPIDDLIDSVGIEAVITSVNALYDQYVAPINVPWVPDMLEPALIDAPAKQLIAAFLRRFHDHIHTP